MAKSQSKSRVIRRKRRRGSESLRYFPYATGSGSGKEDMEKEVERLGVELSLCVAESMFLLCDDIRTMLWFCFKLWKCTIPHWSPVMERLLLVIHYVYSKDIKPKNGVFQEGGDSVQWELVKTTWKDFADGVIVLHRLVLKTKDCSFDDRLLSSAIAKCRNQVLKNLEDKLRSVEDVTKANGFVRETVESNVSVLWKSLFVEEAEQATADVIKSWVTNDLFQPIFGQSWHSEILTLPVYSPYILGKDFAKQELKEEVVRLGVELSLYVAETMFLLCDDIRSMLLFCFNFWRDTKKDLSSGSVVLEKLLRVMHHVYSKYIKPKNGVYKMGGESVHWRLTNTTREDLDAGIKDLDHLVSNLRRKGCYIEGRELTSSIEEALQKVDEKLRCAKDVSEAKGFVWDTMESNVLDLWKSLFDKQTEVAWNLKVTKHGIISDLFHPLMKEEDAKH